MTVSPFEHPFLAGLLGDPEIAQHFSVEADIAAMTAFEVALAQAQAEEGVIPQQAAKAITDAAKTFQPDIDALKQATAKDGVVAPEFVRQLRAAVGEPHGAQVHFGATSQDVIDTSLALRLRPVFDLLLLRTSKLIEAIDALSARDGAKRVMGHTRMQAAIPVTAARKITSWREPLARHLKRIEAAREASATLTFGGAAGTLEKFGDKGVRLAEKLAARLGLKGTDPTRHSERDTIAELASTLSLLTGSLGKMGADVALGAQNEIAEIKLARGGGSSAMAHKVNPVGAEILVTLARFNATLVAGMHQSIVHENERSGAAWTLEWMLLPQMMAATGASLRTAIELAANVSFVEHKS